MNSRCTLPLMLTLGCILMMIATLAPAPAVEMGKGTALPIKGNYTCPIWSPDGQGLALAGPKFQGLFYSDLSGNAMTISNAPLSGWRFSWSPDGQGLAYRTRRENGMGMAMNIAGKDGESKQVSPYENDMFPPKWDKDGVTYRSGDELVTLDKDGKVKSVHSLSQGRGLLSRIAGITASFALSHITGATFTGYGSVLAAQATKDKAEKGIYTDPDNQIWLVDENGKKKKLINVADEDGYFNPVESPNGEDYAVSGLSGDLYVANQNGGAPVTLGNGCNPTWSPDGRFLIFQRTTDDGHNMLSSTLWFACADGTQMTQLTTDGMCEYPSWSPDGKYIVYVIDGVVYIAPIQT